MKKIKLIFVFFQIGVLLYFFFFLGSPIPMCLIARCEKVTWWRPIVQDNASFIFIRQTNHGFGLVYPKTHTSYPSYIYIYIHTRYSRLQIFYMDTSLELIKPYAER